MNEDNPVGNLVANYTISNEREKKALNSPYNMQVVVVIKSWYNHC